MKSLQETYAPNSICFGCGPKNEKGLRIASHVSPSGEVVAEFTPEKHHEAFPGMLNGGIIGSLLDCHSNWTAAWTLMKRTGQAAPPCTVTADFHVKLRAPTPSGQKVRLRAKAVEVLPDLEKPDRVKVEAQCFTVNDDGSEKLTATCSGTFVAVKEGHPAFHRWN
ncbi:PaaI family thioesterase [bacterium]|nr:PaaI family thioesterase [bacterium]